MNPLQQFIADRTPDGWQTRPFWSLFQRVKNTGYPEEELLSVYRDYGVIPKSSRDDNHNKESEDLSGYQLIDKGYLVTNKMKAWQGSIAISRYRGIVSPAYYVYKPLSTEHDDQFLHYLLRSENYIALYGRISKGVRVNQWDLEHEALRNIPVLFPSRDKQKEIADFLDHEIARIDQLIERKTKLISIIKLRHDSYVNKVFEGFEGRKIKTIASYQLSNVDKHILEEEIQVNVVHYTDVYYNDIIALDTELPVGSVTELEKQKSTLCGGEVLITKDSETPEDIAIPAYIESVKPNTVCGYHISIIRPMKILDGRFLFWALKTRKVRDYFMLEAQGVTRYGLPLGKIGDCMIPYTEDLHTQKRLADDLFERNTRNLSLIKKVNRSIDSLKEIKASMITEAVTGQLDIHAWQMRGTGDRILDQIERDTEHEPKSKKARA